MEAVQMLLRLVCVLGNHIKKNDIVAHAVFSADPAQTLTRVIEVQATQLSQQRAAYGLFKLARSSAEHRDTIQRVKGVQALIGLLKRGHEDARLRASWALAELVEDSEERITIFLNEGGVLPAVRLLSTRPVGSLGVALQTMILHLSSIRQSATALAAANIVPVLLAMLKDYREDPDAAGRACAILLRLAFNSEVKKKLIEKGARKVIEAILAGKDVNLEAIGSDDQSMAGDTQSIATRVTSQTTIFSQQSMHIPVHEMEDPFDIQFDEPEREAYHIIETGKQLLFWLEEHNTTPKGKHCFISYNHKHKEHAIRLRDALQAQGVEVWIDVDDLYKNLLEL